MDKTFKRDLSELQAIVADTDAFFAAHGIDASIRMHVDLSIEELFVNMVKYNTGTRRDIRLQLAPSEGGVEVSLTDYDVDPFDPTRVPDVDVDAPLDQRVPNGLGLYLVSKMVDSIHYQYRDRQSRITFIKHADGNPAGDSHA
jgi:anti-sigma regulatory factor (Ser/Thr protein kinase)